ncbi:hypothetical protein [Streptomyces sp. NPDC053048]|uniref:hypothetical protein n=1 Tax=Streptomyces sp. NPDC053048 TaxID=3365694 RepID=UPI0037D0CF35
MPAAAVLVAVAMSAAVGCVSVSPSADRSGPHHLARPAAPEAGPGPARESLVTIGDHPARGRAVAPVTPSPALTRDPSTDPDPIRPWDPPWYPDRDPAGPDGRTPLEPGEVPERDGPARRPERPGSPRQAAPPPASAAAPAAREAPAEPAPQRQAPPPKSRRVEPRPAPEERREAPRHEAPRQEASRQEAPVPAAPAPRGRNGRNVCAMGDTYGKWEKHGDASRICHQVYDR